MPQWNGKPSDTMVEKRSGYEGVNIPVPYKNDLRPNQRNARPEVGGPRDVLKFAQGHQFCGDLGSPATNFFQGSQSPASAQFKAENPSGTRRAPERKDPKVGTIQPLITRSPINTGPTP